MRHYTFLASRPGGFMNWPGYYCKSKARIRVVAAIVFRKWFGRAPTELWAGAGMAVASDERGNSIEVEQQNPRPGWLRLGGSDA